MEFYSCDPCGKNFNGIRPYRDHLESEKHKKKIIQEQLALSAVDLPRSTLEPYFQLSDPFIMPKGRNFWCSLCKLELNGSAPVQSHVNGNKHLKLKSSHLVINEKSIGGEITKLDVSHIKIGDNPKDILDLYSDFKFSFHGVSIGQVLGEIKVFGVNDPIDF